MPTGTTPRRLTSVEFESALASLALAGMRILLQDIKTATAGTHVEYTVVEPNTRRVMIVHLGTNAGDIRLAYKENAKATGFPVIPQAYMVIDAKAGDTISFWNTAGGDIGVNVLELA